ncbi:MAG: protein translocase subunit SecD [Verrucomicrobia bacterium]|nr:protein translocase subunit SecD [Verrucomicrobiota bacterium]
MEKQKKWHLFLILTVIALTIYNILPTVFYYTKPLNEPISSTRAKEIGANIVSRVNDLEPAALDWLNSFCKLIHVKPAAISFENTQLLSVRFSKTEDAAKFRAHLPRAGSLIPFAPAQLSLVPQNNSEDLKNVLVQRKIPIHLDEALFDFATAGSPLYKDLFIDRAAQVAASLAGPSEPASILSLIEKNGPAAIPPEWIHSLADQINALNELPEGSPLYIRTAASFLQAELKEKSKAIQTILSSFDHARDNLKQLKAQASEEDRPLLEKREAVLASAAKILKKHPTLFEAGQTPWTSQETVTFLQSTSTLEIGSRNPYFSQVSIDWEKQQIRLKLHSDVAKIRAKQKNERIEQLLINEVAKLTRLSNETFVSEESGYTISFHEMTDTKSLLVMKLNETAQKTAEQLLIAVKNRWRPKHPDLSAENFPIVDFSTYQHLSPEQKALCLVAFAPAASSNIKSTGIKNSSIYFLAKGLTRIGQNYEQFPDSELAKTFRADLQSLQMLLRQNGFAAYHGAAFPQIEDLASDIVFEQHDFFANTLAATREDFYVKGTSKYAFLELGSVEQRILAQNKIDTQIHEDLLKWKDEHRSALVSLDPALAYDVPEPTRSVFWSNIGLTVRKMLRGDERKIIRWGLDLSGGKTVQIELRDSNNIAVKNEADLKQGINELFNRVNKMGVSEVSIRQLGNQIVLDFPGSQALSASDLVRASTMYFHIVNEKFSVQNPTLSEHTNRFLQEVWNEAQVTNRKDAQSVNAIAWKHLYGEDSTTPQPRSESARILMDHGLSLQSPKDPSMSHIVNDAVSKIAIFRGNDTSEWHHQSHPLLIVFKNFALEGSNLVNVHSSYDPSHGNYLSFEVRGATLNREGQKINPREDLYAWTSRFSKPKVAGTPLETYSRGQGWRMAVILNDTIISSPTLNESLKDSAMISGSFSQREANQLTADLKAGSLTFTPHILSEKNVSPELGKTDRLKGIVATFVSLALIIVSMVGYYRFAGLIASIAVLFNILIMWATLQNMGATLSLAGIAGLILTVGMAVDANVLVFERMKEELSTTGRIGSAIAAGYKKAFSAILDSNVTTIIAALILLNFDAGPIKAFATTLIIGIASSMFTALFMTRFYFTKWAQNPKNKVLTMANWIRPTNFNFLKWAKVSFISAAAIILIGGSLVYQQRSSMLGMDFTGGFALNLELEKTADENYSSQIEKILLGKGLFPQEFQIRTLSPSNHVRILFSTNLEQPGKPFANMPLEIDLKEAKYLFEKNPRIEWVVQTLGSSGIKLSHNSLADLHTNWTAMSGQMSDSMRNNALIGLLIAFVSIFIYIAFRFEYKFAAAASLCLLHDVCITLGVMGLLHAFGIPMQIDLNTVAAIMTIIGYSLNDTIIIFDRIREDMNQTRQRDLGPLVNRALNATLSRTTITSGTTLLVLLALVFLGGSSIFSFAFVMTIGVIFGTLSSWFIASPLMLYFHTKEDKIPQNNPT